jgi:hypothetical protein
MSLEQGIIQATQAYLHYRRHDIDASIIQSLPFDLEIDGQTRHAEVKPRSATS